MDAKYVNLIEKLTKLTVDGNIEWEKSSTEWQYRLELKSATFVIDKTQEIVNLSTYAEVYELTMYNNSNVEITIAKETNTTSTSADYSILQELYCAAENSCLKETETIKKVMDELNSLDLPF